MKVLTLTAGILIAMSLTACGGSGSSTATGNPTTSLLGNKTTTTTTTDTTTDTTADAADAVDNTAGGGTGTTGTTTTTATADTIGVAGNVIAINNNIASANQALSGSTDINKIIVGGQTIDFIPQGIEATIINRIDVKTGVGRLGEKYDHSMYGYVQENVNSTPYFFSQGNISAKTPVANIAKYEGKAVYFNKNIGNQDKLKNPTGLIHLGTTPQSEEEKVTFVADFTNKILTGNLASIVEIEGKIVDNGFSGTKNGITTNGYFYGDNAAELGGTYQNTDGTISGAYGAKRTE